MALWSDINRKINLEKKNWWPVEWKENDGSFHNSFKYSRCLLHLLTMLVWELHWVLILLYSFQLHLSCHVWFNLFVLCLLDFSFVNLVLNTFLRFSLCAILCCFAFFLLVLLAYSIEFVHLILSLDVVQFFHLSFSWFCFLLCYSYVEEFECSWFIWLETHWFGNFVGDYLSLEGRAEGGIVRKDIEIAFRENFFYFCFDITEFCGVIFSYFSFCFIWLRWKNALQQS